MLQIDRDTEEDDPISPSGFSLDLPVFESLSAPADFVELGLI